jgi:hypothetical protein
MNEWRPYRSGMLTRVAFRLLAVGVGLALLGSAAPASASIDKAKSLSSAKLKALTNSIDKGKHLTYDATYKSVSGGQSETVTIAQAPPKSIFTSGSGSVIDTGQKTYYCSAQGTSESCLSAGGANPFVGLEELFSPSLALSAFSEAKEGLVSRLLGIKASESTETIAGQASTCVTVTVRGHGGKYCVTKEGLLSYSGATSSSYFELTKFSKSPPSSLFALPAGATTVTLPGGASIP